MDRVDRCKTFGYVSKEEVLAVLYFRSIDMTYQEIAAICNISIKRVEYIITNKRLTKG